MMNNDFTESGLKVEGAWENDRNTNSKDLFKDIIREAFDVEDTIIGHHLLYVVEDKRPDGFTYQVVQEIPSADALIFDTGVAKKIWGNSWKEKVRRLAVEPCDTRDALLAEMYYNRTTCGPKGGTNA